MKLTKRKDGRWQYAYTPQKGKSQKYLYSSATTQKQAEKEIISKLQSINILKESGEYFHIIVDKWNSDYRLKNSEINYRKNLKSAYERILQYFGNVIRINDLTAVELNLFINKLILQNYAKKTIATHKSVLNMIFSYAILNDYARYNPMQDIKLPSGLPKKQREIPKTDDIKIISQHNTGFELLPYFLLYYRLQKIRGTCNKKRGY